MMRRDGHGDEHVASLAARQCEPLPFQPDRLAVCEAGRHLDLELLAGRQRDASRCPFGSLFERDGGVGGDVAARRLSELLLLEGCTARTAATCATATTEPTKHVAQDVV